MPYERLNIQLAVKLDSQGRLPTELRVKPTQGELNAIADMTYAQIVLAMIRKLKSLSSKINEGLDNEEMTVVAKRHTCAHDANPAFLCTEEDI
jgi:hypothetical protein